MWKRLIEEYGLDAKFNEEDEDVQLSGDDHTDSSTPTPVQPVDDKKRLLQIALINSRFTLNDGQPILIPGTEMLYLGSIGAAYNLKGLVQHGVTHVLCLSEAIRLKYIGQALNYKRVVMRDRVDFDLLSTLDECLSFIEAVRWHNESFPERPPQKVLVHCYQGVSRSSAVCIAYLIKHCHLSLEDAYALVKAVRPQARPNNGFMLALRRLEASCNSGNVLIPV